MKVSVLSERQVSPRMRQRRGEVITEPGISHMQLSSPRRLRGNAGRGQYWVKCWYCRHEQFFDAFSWAGHGVLRCKCCHWYIQHGTGRTAPTREGLRVAPDKEKGTGGEE
jgi:ribosomal protein S27E